MKSCLEGRVALVTGAGSGIGRAGAIAMAAEGATLVVTDLRAELAEATAQAIREAGGQAESAALDARDDAAITETVSGVAARYGRLDVVHSHVGIQIAGKLEDVTPTQMDLAWAMNVRSHFVVAQAALVPMRAQGGDR